MPSPFPGVDPYLENPELWPEVRHRLMTAIADTLAPSVRPKYRVAIEQRTYFSEVEDSVLVGIPDISVFSKPSAGNQSPATATLTLPILEETREGYLEIREVGTGEVITVIKVLFPKNKRAGVGRDAYQSKRQQVLSSGTHLVEIHFLGAENQCP